MLVVTRKTNESLVISDNIEITVLEVSKDRVKIGIQAPKDVKIIRSELRETQQANRASSEAISQDVLKAFLNMNIKKGDIS